METGKSKEKHFLNKEWETQFTGALSKMGFDSYGQVWEPCLARFMSEIKCEDSSHQKFENEVFVLMPYYWGEDKKLFNLPNFLFKPTGFEISWYKYPLHSSYMNQEISHEEFMRILEECKKSI